MHTDFKVGMYWGEMGVDFWDGDMWKQQVEKYEVGILMMQIILHIVLSQKLRLDTSSAFYFIPI